MSIKDRNYFKRQFVLVFHCCDKIPEQNSLREERFILAHSFRGFRPWSTASIAFRPVARHKHHGDGHFTGKLLMS
jgi:hypothetical protein